MTDSVFSPEYRLVTEKLLEMRKRAGLTQRELAAKLNRELSFVSRIEKGQRRVDLVEFSWICRACGANPAEESQQLFMAMSKVKRNN